MAALTLAQIFGQNVSTNIDEINSNFEITLDLRDFQNTENGGQIKNNLGITNLDAEAAYYAKGGSKAVNLFYAILLLVSQNQAENINADPEQKIFISQSPKRFGIGSRTGQIQTSFVINFFTPSDAANLPDIDDL